MKIIRFYEGAGSMKLRVDTLEDLWTLQRILFPDDLVKSESVRRFRSSESDVGELKDVVVRLRLERTELDKNAERLRVMGKIVEGKPMDYIRLNSYHTLNIAPGDELEITKAHWHDYIIDVLRNAVSDSKRPRLGLIVADEEKALPAYLLGYGVQFGNEVYSRLSKRMSQKEFTETETKYFNAIIALATGMKADTVVIAGPGFTKEDVKKRMEDAGDLKKPSKRFIFEGASNTERTGIYELIRSDRVGRILERERIRQEFALMEQFLTGLSVGRSKYGAEGVSKAIEDYEAKAVLVNDSMLGERGVQAVLEKAERNRVKIEVFNSADEVGQQLASFKGVASIS
jgi:protein pelota